MTWLGAVIDWLDRSLNREDLASGRRRSNGVIALLILLAVAFAIFANTFGAEWSYDDYPVIVENPDVLSLSNFFANSYPGRPLREVTFLLDHALFGMQPMGWHIQHVFWHGLCAWLVWLLAMRLDFGRTVAWLAALLFLVHPLQVEVVANISHRKESLAVAFRVSKTPMPVVATASNSGTIVVLSSARSSSIDAALGRSRLLYWTT